MKIKTTMLYELGELLEKYLNKRIRDLEKQNEKLWQKNMELRLKLHDKGPTRVDRQICEEYKYRRDFILYRLYENGSNYKEIASLADISLERARDLVRKHYLKHHHKEEKTPQQQ